MYADSEMSTAIISFNIKMFSFNCMILFYQISKLLSFVEYELSINKHYLQFAQIKTKKRILTNINIYF